MFFDWQLSTKATQEDEAVELQMLEMKRNSQNRAIRIATGMTPGSGVLENV
jgi:hypothetical protein